MKRLTQFSIRSLLVLTLAVAIGCWWWQLPDATARRFVANPQAFQKRAGTTGLSDYDPVNWFAAEVSQEKNLALQPHPRTFWDSLAGRRSFTSGPFRFTVERGRITHGPLDMRMFVCPTSALPETNDRPIVLRRATDYQDQP